MASKSVYIPELDTEVIIAKRKGARSIRLSIRSDGKVRAGAPHYVSEKKIIDFIKSKADWIQKHIPDVILLSDGDHIGKNHRIVFNATDSTRVSSRVTDTEIRVTISDHLDWQSEQVQDNVAKAATKALMQESERLLPQRLKILADQHGFSYRSVGIKKLKSRWGSCDSRNNIILNCYLIQLDWSLIDYVLLHELTHTIHKHHDDPLSSGALLS